MKKHLKYEKLVNKTPMKKKDKLWIERIEWTCTHNKNHDDTVNWIGHAERIIDNTENRSINYKVGETYLETPYLYFKTVGWMHIYAKDA